MVAPPYFTIPPEGYGGVENVVAGLVDGLVDHGHQVTLLAAGDHETRAQRFVRTWDEHPVTSSGRPCRRSSTPPGSRPDRCRRRLRRRPRPQPGRPAAGPRPTGADRRDRARPDERAGRRLPTARWRRVPGGDLREPAASAADLNWVGTVHNAIDVSSFPFRDRKDDYVLFLGRFHETKGPHLAIDAARAAGVRILLAGKCAEPPEQEFYEAEISPRLGPEAVYVGDADSDEKRRLLAGARCLLFPIRWDEPFGMVMVEAMACGTPVVALSNGSVPEVVVDGCTGVVVSTSGSCPAPSSAKGLDPADCSRHAENASASRP